MSTPTNPPAPAPTPASAPESTSPNLHSPSLSHCLMAGLIAGIAAGFCANAANFLFEIGFGRKFEELTPVSIAIASLIMCLLGSIVYWALARSTKRPALWFIVLGLAAATLDSIPPLVGDFPKGFALQANVLHYVVAAAAFFTIPPVSRVRGGVVRI